MQDAFEYVDYWMAFAFGVGFAGVLVAAWLGVKLFRALATTILGQLTLLLVPLPFLGGLSRYMYLHGESWEFLTVTVGLACYAALGLVHLINRSING